jgi:membrane protein
MQFLRLLVRAARVWVREEADQHAAALAYFTPFALTPLIIFSISIVGFFFGSAQVTDLLVGWGNAVDPGVTELLHHSVNNFDLLTTHYYVPVVGVVFLTIMIFITLNSLMAGLHKMWGVRGGGWRKLPAKFWRISIFIAVIEAYIVFTIMMGDMVEGIKFLTGWTVWPFLIFITSLLSTMMLLTIAYGLLALQSPSFKGRFFGAALAGIVLLFSRELVALHFSTAPVQSLFGAAGLLISLLVWVYVGSGVILYGAAFARVYDEAHGRAQLPTIE